MRESGIGRTVWLGYHGSTMKTLASMILVALFTLPASAEQLWMDVKGNMLFGTLEKADGTTAYIEDNDGKTVRVLIARLDAKGRDAVNAWKKAQANANNPTPAFRPQTATPRPKTAKPDKPKRRCGTCPLRR